MKLQSPVVELCPVRNDLLNLMDRMFPCGLDNSVDDLDTSLEMLSIIACGDQSVGKSTLLSAITGIQFPTNKSKCSPFIIELALRRDQVASTSVEIRPGPKRSEKEQQALRAFCQCTRDLDISGTMKEAEEIIRLNTTDTLFCGDVLRIEIAGPTQPHLTLVDLPGLFLAGNNTQFKKYAKRAKSKMLDYITVERSIILVVVSAETEFVPWRVFAHARSFDSEGIRTLGVITKPDTLDVGSESERFYVELAQNIHHFQFGWNVLCSRPYAATTERDQIEADFLANGIWRSLDPSICGIKALRTCVGDMIYEEVANELLGLISDAEALVNSSEKHLSRWGSPRDTIDQKRQFLFCIGTAFSDVLKAAVDGLYTGPFFVCSETTRPRLFSRRLRTVIQSILSDFAVKMREEGQAQIIQDDEAPSTADSRRISRAQYIQEVNELMGNYRGSELLETHNPLIVSEILSKQCAPWRDLIRELGDTVMHSVETVVNEVLYYVTDISMAARISRLIIGPSLQQLSQGLRSKLNELLEPHALIDSLVAKREPDLDAYPYTAIDTADAYYKIALEKTIDDVSVLAIERCLIQKLPGLLAADIICHLTDDMVHSIASESEDSTTRRVRETERLAVLREGLIELGEFKKQI
ncbi:P-loop containing nucleoside triphosphate hydrolase protein [Xylaria castorea]|nr:P-loop containing nucleoside triphosphate hydrolase protein [Xylaria castorea]